jgi:hypothetical protein
LSNYNPFNPFANCDLELEENTWVLDKDKFTADNLFWGACGERVVLAATRMSFKKKDGFNLKYNKFDSQYQYCSGTGMDITINYAPNSYQQIAAIEVKNLADKQKKYGLKWAKEKVNSNSRVNYLDVLAKKVLILTFKKMLTKPAIAYLIQEGWDIIEVGERLTYDFFKRENLSKLYNLSAKIKSVAQNIIKPKAKPKNEKPVIKAEFYNSLDNYAVEDTRNRNNNSNSIINDTGIDNNTIELTKNYLESKNQCLMTLPKVLMLYQGLFEETSFGE